MRGYDCTGTSSFLHGSEGPVAAWCPSGFFAATFGVLPQLSSGTVKLGQSTVLANRGSGIPQTCCLHAVLCVLGGRSLAHVALHFAFVP